jgi:hypothetical protein
MRVDYEFGEEGLGKDFGGAQMPGAQGFGQRSKVSAGLMTGGHASCACLRLHGPRLVCRSRMEADRRILLA